MPELTTIDDLLNKNRLDGPEEEALVANKLRQDKRGQIKKIEIKKKITVEVKEKKKPGEKGGAKEKPGKADKGKTKPQAEGEGENKPGGKGEEGGKPGEKPEGEEKPEEKPEGGEKLGKEGEGENKPGEEGEEGEKPGKEGKEGEGGERPGEEGEGKDKPEGGERPGEENKEDEGKKEERPEDEGKEEEKPGEEGEGKEKPEGENKPREKGGEGEKPGKEGEGARGQPANLGGDVDSRLMAGQLREEKNKERERKEAGGEKGEEAKKSPEGEEAGEGGGLRGRIRQLREKANLKKRAQEKIEKTVMAPVKQGTNWLLRAAWKALIPSWGLSSFWINIHVYLKSVFGEKLFCKLGEEWIPKEAQAVAGEAGKTGSKAFGLVEVMVLAFIDIIIFFIIVGLVAMFTNESTFKTMTGESNKTQQAPAVQQTK